MSKGFIIAAPASNSGKTTVTLALLRALRNRGRRISSLKIGPDYIDPAFHRAASGRECFNLDPWAMRPATRAEVIARAGTDADLVIVEGVMGLFDGARDGSGSSADVAAETGWPVILVIDASGMAASVAALVRGFTNFRDDVRIAGVVFNRIGGPGHARILERACATDEVPVLGCVPRDAALKLPDRHLGLVQAAEHPDLEPFLETAALNLAEHVDLAAVEAVAQAARDPGPRARQPVPPPGIRVSVACDVAFAFSYPLLLDDWRAGGAELEFFSPLADQAPAADADAVYLPGGYPELHAARLADNQVFLTGLRAAAARDAVIYGECGGYMVLGETLTDAGGRKHRMAGLLPLATSFAERRLHLGYRDAILAADTPLGPRGTHLRGHEFHFATIENEADDAPLFELHDADGQSVGSSGSRRGSVMGSFVHLIDAAE